MNFTKTGVFKGTLLVASILSLGMPAAAVPVYGTIGFSGSRLFSFSIPALPDPTAVSYIDFQDPVNGGSGALVSGGTLGAFYNANVPTFTPGTIKDMASGPNGLGYTVVPVGATVSVDNFITFSTIPTTNFRLTQLPFATNCGVNVTCVNAFQLVQSGQNVSVSINILGQILNGPDAVDFQGLITAQFSNTNVNAVIAGASAPGGVLANSWSGEIVSGIPEPGTVTMLGIGLIAMVLGGRRMQWRSSN